MARIMFKIVRICNSQFKSNYLKNEKAFLNFLLHFWNLHQYLNILNKRMIVIANVFPKLETVNILLRPLFKKRLFRTRFDREQVKASETLAKSPWERFCHVFSSFSGKLIWKMSSIVWGEVLVVFFIRLTADGSIMFKIVRICNSQLKCNYLKKEKAFFNFFSISGLYIKF